MKKIFYFLPIIFILITACQSAQPELHQLYPGDVILAFGDSLTYGTGASLEASYPHDLEEMTGLKVINGGVPGDETQNGLARIALELDQSKPKLVILLLGGNDLLRKRPYAEIKDNLKKIIQIIQKSGAQVVLIGMPTLSLTLSVPDFYSELGSELNIPVNTTIMPELYEHPEYKSDYVHFNQAGYRALSEALVQFLKEEGALNSNAH